MNETSSARDTAVVVLREVGTVPRGASARIRQQVFERLASGQLSQAVLDADAAMGERALRLSTRGAGSAFTASRLLAAAVLTLATGSAVWIAQQPKPRAAPLMAAARGRAHSTVPAPLAGEAKPAQPPSELTTATGKLSTANASDPLVAAQQHAAAKSAAVRNSGLQRSVARSASPVASPAAAAEPPGFQLEQETALIRTASAALQRHDAPAALRALAQHAQRFPSGSLARERGALHVLALCAQGPSETALQERARYLQRNGGSPLAERVRKACAPAVQAPGATQ